MLPEDMNVKTGLDSVQAPNVYGKRGCCASLTAKVPAPVINRYHVHHKTKEAA